MKSGTVYSIDIHPSYYEEGSGYNWKKIPGVEFTYDMFSVDCLDGDPEEFSNYTDEF